MSYEFLFTALFAVSVLTTLTVQGIKTLLNKEDKNYSSNVLAVIVSTVLSVAISVCYIVYTNVAVTAQVVIEIIVLVYLSFLVATNGYDKVVQAIDQIRRK